MTLKPDQQAMFVTGGASGLGREVARYFAGRGWFIGIADIDEAGMEATAAMIPEGQSSVHRLDVTDRAAWKKAVAEFGERTGGKMHVLFNNAGIGTGGAIQDMEDEDIDRMIAVNITGVINGTRAAFDLLHDTARKGGDCCVLYTASAAGIYGVSDLSIYSATKFAVRGLAESHDLEFAKYGIKSRCLMPGFIDTDIISEVVEGTNMTGKERLEEAGVPVSPVEVIGPAAWDAIHGDKVHKPVNKTATQLAFAARWMPARLRKQQVALANLGNVLGAPPDK